MKIPSSKVISYINIICEIYKLLPPILICEKYLHKRLTDKLLEQVVQAELVIQSVVQEIGSAPSTNETKGYGYSLCIGNFGRSLAFSMSCKRTLYAKSPTTKPATLCRQCNAKNNSFNTSCCTCNKSLKLQQRNAHMPNFAHPAYVCSMHFGKCVKCNANTHGTNNPASQCKQCKGNNPNILKCCAKATPPSTRQTPSIPPTRSTPENEEGKKVDGVLIVIGKKDLPPPTPPSLVDHQLPGETKATDLIVKVKTETPLELALTKEEKDTVELAFVELQEAIKNKQWSVVERLVTSHSQLASRNVEYRAQLYQGNNAPRMTINPPLLAILDDGSKDNEESSSEAQSACFKLVEAYPAATACIIQGTVGIIALSRAISLGWTSVVRAMLQVYPEAARKRQGDYGTIPLHFSVMSRERADVEIVRALLQVYPEGCSINDTSNFNRTPLAVAYYNQVSLEIISLLVEINPEMIEWSKPGNCEQSILSSVLIKALLLDDDDSDDDLKKNLKENKEEEEEEEEEAKKSAAGRSYFLTLRETWLENVHNRNISSERLLSIHQRVTKNVLGTFKDLISSTTQERQNKRWRLFLRAAHEIPVNRENSIIAKEIADKCRSEILKDACQWCPPKFVLENLIFEWGADPNIPYDMGGGWGGGEENGRYVLFVALENCNKNQKSMNDETLALLMTEKALSSVDSNGNSSLHLLCKSLVCRRSDVTDSVTGKIIPPKQLSTRSMETIQRFANASPLQQRNSNGETPLWCFLHDCNLYNHLARDFSQNVVQHDIFESEDVERHWRSAHVFLQSLLSCRPSMARATKQHTMSVGGTSHSLEIYPIQMVSGFQSRDAWTSKRQQHSRFQGNAPLYFLNELWRHMEHSQNSNKEIDLHPTVLLQQALCANMFDVALSLLASYDPKTVRPAGVLPLHTALIHGAPSDLVRELIKLDPTSLHMGANVTLGGQHLIEVPPQRNDLPIHLVLDDCHDRMRKWCSSEESVLEVLEGYAKHCPEYLSHGGDTTTNTRTFGTRKSISYECDITGISEMSTATAAVGVGCPLQLELARVGCGSDGADLLRTGPRWNVVRKILQVRFFLVIFRALGRSTHDYTYPCNSHVPLLSVLSFPFFSFPFLSAVSIFG